MSEYLVAGIRTAPEHMTSPGYRAFLAWLDGQDLDEQGHVYEFKTAQDLPPGERVYATYKTLTVWDGPLRGVVAVYDLDGDGGRIPDGSGGYSTHDEDVVLTSLPNNQGTMPDPDPDRP
ncbi:hypothetical protein [Streptosporangium saharense]|uniref:hypothetical protein n=1 Tax=Streptosporangium saharense TaxID=1706840 RepID=UPI0034344753